MKYSILKVKIFVLKVKTLFKVTKIVKLQLGSLIFFPIRADIFYNNSQLYFVFQHSAILELSIF